MKYLFFVFVIFSLGCATGSNRQRAYNMEMTYLLRIHERGRDLNPSLTLLLMNEFLNTNNVEKGLAFFRERLDLKVDTMPQRRALMLACLATLRLRNADKIFLLKRTAWVEDSIALLDEARAKGSSEVLIRWLSGTTLSQVPERFGQSARAMKDLNWVVDHENQLTEFGLGGFIREVFFQLARLYKAKNDLKKATYFLKRSQYESFERQRVVLTSFSVDQKTGHKFGVRKIEEVVGQRIFNIRGFGFTDFYFVLSKDRKELIGIDSGSTPKAARAAYESLHRMYANLPKISAIIFTHAHWDHIGGYKFFKKVNPEIRLISRANYKDELSNMGEEPYFQYFFGKQYHAKYIQGFAPTELVDERKTLSIGGTAFEIIPVEGGETVDGVFIHLPELKTTFVGDFAMPYFGAPFLPEGSPDEFLPAVSILEDLNSKHILHGHQTLTQLFNPPSLLRHLGEALAADRREIIKAYRAGKSREMILKEIPFPEIVFTHPEIQLVYMVTRENHINRVYAQRKGYWATDLSGMDYLSEQDFGIFLRSYLNMDEGALIGLVEEMNQNSDFALSLRITKWGLTQFSDSKPLNALRRRAFLGMIQKYQATNPFKFIIYSEAGRWDTKQLEGE